MSESEIESFTPKNKQEWRDWLELNHRESQAVWLIQYKKSAGKHYLSWSDAVDEALCFGWIDSVRKTVDKDSYKQFFSKRKGNSTWSKVNKEKVEQLMAANLMTEAGMKCINIAKQNGSWTILDSVDALLVPDDLQKAFDANPNSQAYYLSVSNSIKKRILYWFVSAKRAETREKRIEELIANTEKNQLPKHFK